MNIQKYFDENKEAWRKKFPRIMDIAIEPHPLDVEIALTTFDLWIKNGSKGPRPKSPECRDCIAVYVEGGVSEQDQEILDEISTEYEAVIKPEMILME